MASSPGNSFAPRPRAVITLGIGLSAALLGAADMAHAALGIGATTCANQEIVVEAKPGMEVEYRTNNAVLRDVVITQCDTRIRAAEARFTGGLNFENGRWTFTGDVRMNAEGGNLKADKAVVSFRNNLISQATITGSPAEFEQKRTDGSTARGHAGTIDYETASGTVSFTHDAWLSYGRNTASAQQLVYNIKTQTFQGQPKNSAIKTGNERIRFVIQPKNTEQKNEKEEKKQ